jgi:UDP:flavonoid glycosyltransferase YjiC (YdhE family)
MAKFLFFPYSNQLGSTIPSITLANMLVQGGHEVIYASNGKYTEVLRQKGFHVVPINEISYLQYRQHVDENNVDFYQTSLIQHFVEKELELIEAINPDVIVTNNRPTIKISAQLAQKKLVNIVIPTLTRYYNHRYYVPENHFLNTLYPFGDVNKVTPDSVTQFAFNKTMQHWARNFKKMCKKYGISVMKDYLDVYIGDVTLINQTKGITPFKPLPENYFFLKQDLGSTFGLQHTWLHELEKHKQQGKKIIFVSMGSSAIKSYPMVMNNINGLVKGVEQFVLISNHVGMWDVSDKHERIYTEPFINSPAVMPYVDLMITHGGINTLSECVLKKIPFIGVPEQGEQMWNLKYMESLGIGKMVSKFKLEKDPSLLTKAILEVINDDSYKKRVTHFVDTNIDFSSNENDKIYEAVMKLL